MVVHENSLKNLTCKGAFKNVPGLAEKAAAKSSGRGGVLAKALSAIGITKKELEDIDDISSIKLNKDELHKLMTAILSTPIDKIKKLERNGKIPILLGILVRGLLKDLYKGKTDVLRDILDRLYGKSDQKTELSGDAVGAFVTQVNVNFISPEKA